MLERIWKTGGLWGFPACWEDRVKVSCGKEPEELISLAAGELPLGKEREVRDHVEGCRECRKFLDWYLRFRDTVASGRFVEPPAEVLERAIRIFREERKQP